MPFLSTETATLCKSPRAFHLAGRRKERHLSSHPRVVATHLSVMMQIQNLSPERYTFLLKWEMCVHAAWRHSTIVLTCIGRLTPREASGTTFIPLMSVWRCHLLQINSTTIIIIEIYHKGMGIALDHSCQPTSRRSSLDLPRPFWSITRLDGPLCGSLLRALAGSFRIRNQSISPVLSARIASRHESQR